MKQSDALNTERNRKELNDINTIYLHKDGKFYHLYEWSAWLLKKYVCTEELQRERGDSSVLAAKFVKTKNDEYVLAGFPLESVGKYVPEYDTMENIDENTLCVTITTDITDYDKALADYEEWRKACPLKEKQKSFKEITCGAGKPAALGRSGLFQIASQILAYPVENATPAENIEFISSLRKQIVGLL